jgi:hypothetical protein
MNMPPPAVIRELRSDLDQVSDHPYKSRFQKKRLAFRTFGPVVDTIFLSRMKVGGGTRKVIVL